MTPRFSVGAQLWKFSADSVIVKLPLRNTAIVHRLASYQGEARDRSQLEKKWIINGKFYYK